MNNEEIWVDIKGFEGFYQVSNLGNVKSLLNRYKNTKQVFNLVQEISSKYGHRRVQFSKPVRKRLLVHRLVAEAFIENPENKPQINHIDNDPSNNRVSNIEWCTGSENLMHAQRQGRLFAAQSKGGKIGVLKKIENCRNESIEMIGKIFNDWTVLSLSKNKYPSVSNKYGTTYFYCQCKCGFIKELAKSYLRNGTATCCYRCSCEKRRVKI